MRPLNHAVPGALADLFRRAPLSAGKVTFAWRTAVGSAVDRATTVRLENQVLVVETTSDQWSREIARSSAIIVSRLQAYLGEDAVARLEIRKRT